MSLTLVYIGAAAGLVPAASLQALAGGGAVLLPESLEPDLDEETAEAVGRYMSSRRTVSDHYRIGSRDYYRNKAGLCEDAPCCGCCNF